MEISLGKGFLSFLLTVSLLIISLGVLRETHRYSSVLAPQSTLINAFNIICPVLSIFTYIAPVVSVIAMVREKSSSQFPIGVIQAQAFQNITCAAYGIHIASEPFFLSSAIGLIFQLIWITVWLSFKRRQLKTSCLKICHPVVVSLGLTILIIISVHILSNISRDVVGVLCVVMSFLLCVSPLLTLGIVVRSRNSASIPFFMSLVMLLSNAAWTIYGFLLKDAYIILPSVFGFIITVFQILVTAWCSGFLFYELAFLQLIYGGYQSVESCEYPNTLRHNRTEQEPSGTEMHESSN